MKIVFISRYGSKNIGDQLIVREMEKYLSMYSSEIQRYNFKLNYFDDINDSFNNNDKNIRRIHKNNLFKSILKKNKFFNMFLNVKNRFVFLSNKNYKSYANIFSDVDALIIGGGNALYDAGKYSESYKYFEYMIKPALKNNKKVFLLNIGVGPFNSQKQYEGAKNVLSKVEVISVRDNKSFDLIKLIDDVRKYITVDPVAIMKTDISHKTIIRNIGINIMDIRLAEFSEKDYMEYIKSMVVLIKSLESYYNISLFITEESDMAAYNDIQKIIGKDNYAFYNINNVELVEEFYKNCDFIIGTRMHSCIIAFSYAIPFIGISWQQKVEGFFNLIQYNSNIFKIEDFETHLMSIIDIVKSADLINERSVLLDKKEKLKDEFQELKILKEIINYSYENNN